MFDEFDELRERENALAQAAWRGYNDLPEALGNALRSSKLGGYAQFSALAPDVPAIGEVHETVRAEVPPEYAAPWVVQLSQVPPVVTRPAVLDSSLDMLRIFARVTFGVGGANAMVEVDYRQGCAFTVWGSFVQVELVRPLALPQGPVRLGASATYGATGPSNNYVTRTQFYGAIAFGTSASQRVPPYAAQFCHSFVPAAAGGASARRIHFQRTAGAPITIATYDYQGTSASNVPRYGGWHPVPPEAVIANFDNNSANSYTQVQVCYRLGL